MYIIIYGNPVDGLQFIGPFTEPGLANSYAETRLKHETWWVGTMQKPVRQRNLTIEVSCQDCISGCAKCDPYHNDSHGG